MKTPRFAATEEGVQAHPAGMGWAIFRALPRTRAKRLAHKV